MEQKLLSINVGSDVTRICEVIRKSAKNIIVNNAAEITTPQGCVDDGYITDVSVLAEAIRSCIFGRGYTANRVVFTLSSKKIASKEVMLPALRNPKKLNQVLHANSSEYFPMSTAGDYLFAMSVMETVTDDEGKKCRVTAVAAPKDMVEGYYELAEELKIYVENIDYVGNSVIQLLSLQMKDNTELVLQVEKDITFVNVMSGTSVVLQRTIPYGKNSVINSMMEIKKLTEKEAKTLLSNKELLDRSISEEEYSEVVRYLVSSIGRIVEYHRSRNPERIIDGIKIFGEGSSIAGLDEILQQELGAEVSHFKTLQGVAVKEKAYLTGEAALRYLANIGAVIKPIGLTTHFDKAEVRAAKDANRVMFLILALATVISLVYCTYQYITLFSKQNDKKDLEVAIERIQDIETIANNYNVAVSEFDIVNNFLAGTNSPNETLLQFINDLERIMPKGAHIANLQAKDGAVSFRMTVGPKQEIADFIVQLKELSYISNVSIPGTTESRDELGMNPVNNYDFSCVMSDYDYNSNAENGNEGGIVK